MAKLQFLKQIEKEFTGNSYEVNANENLKKFFVTYTFQYMNSVSHLGHVYTMLKGEITSRYYRLNGHNVLFPFGFHCTGLPISASARALADELTCQQSTESKQQVNLLKIGIPPIEIPNFTDPLYWIKYFPQVALQELPLLDCAIDYRRSFITTEQNPYFDSFVKWQYNKLFSLGLLEYGKKLVIYSAKDKQPCSDADRVQGEGVKIKEMKIAYVSVEGGGFYVTYDETVPNGKIVKSGKFKPMEYQILENRNIDINKKYSCYTKLYLNEHFYDNLINQPKSQLKAFCWNSSLILNNVLDHQKIINYFKSLDVCNKDYGSGLYSSDNTLNWVTYSEPESEVISRSGDRCTVAEIDQWFINYNNTLWKERVVNFIENGNIYFWEESVKNLLLEAVKNMNSWAVSRTFGLGSRLPFDERYLIDSLSDSTIYMAFYTISHLIKEIPISELCDDIWDSIFFGVNNYGSEIISKMRKEFCYWYPMDIRVSGRDLISNHLAMMLYHHIVIFGEDFMPKSIYVNGHIMVNKEKMSKSKGNFITLKQCIENYGSNVTRIMAATAGDTSDSANFNPSEADNWILSLTAELEIWSGLFNSTQPNLRTAALIKDLRIASMRTGELEFIDKMYLINLQKIMNNNHQHYKNIRFRDVVKNGFHDLINLRNRYLNPHKNVFLLYLQAELIIMAPIIPNFCQYLSGKTGIQIAYPEITLDTQINYHEMEWLFDYCQRLEQLIKNKLKINKTGGKNCNIIINNDISKFTCLINKDCQIDKEQIREIIKNFKEKSDVKFVLNLINIINGENSQNILQWLQQDNSHVIISYLKINNSEYNFKVVYDKSSTFNPINPKILFY